MSASIRPLIAAAALTAALAACDDPYSVEAQAEVVADTFALYSINDAPTGAPTAISFFARSGVAANGAFNFDVAFDVNAAAGTVRLIPNSRLSGGLVNSYRVGLQRITSYDQLKTAPASGYTYDSVFVLRPGEAVAIESSNPAACPIAFYGTAIYAKLVVDSLRTSPGRVFFRATTDPNCGFRSLEPGSRPKE